MHTVAPCHNKHGGRSTSRRGHRSVSPPDAISRSQATQRPKSTSRSPSGTDPDRSGRRLQVGKHIFSGCGAVLGLRISDSSHYHSGRQADQSCQQYIFPHHNYLQKLSVKIKRNKYKQSVWENERETGHFHPFCYLCTDNRSTVPNLWHATDSTSIFTHRSNDPYVIDAYAVGSDGSLPAGPYSAEYIREVQRITPDNTSDTDRTYSMLSPRCIAVGEIGLIMQLRRFSPQNGTRHWFEQWSWQRTAACR